MSYRMVLTPRLLGWVVASTLVRLPVAMAAMAMVFLGRGSAGGYTEGGTLAAVYVVGEVVGSGLLGTLLPPHRMRLNLVAGIAVGAVGFGVVFADPHAPTAVLGIGAFVAGAAPAVAPGALRSVLTGSVAEADLPEALSADSVLTELIWMAAPGVVVLLALRVSARAPLGLCAASMAGAALAALGLRALRPDAEESRPRRPAARVLVSGWPIYVTAAAAMSLSAVAELDLPPLLQSRHAAVGLAGVLLVAFGALSTLGSFLYGLRTWPGSARRHSMLFLAATAGAVSVEALVPDLPGIVAGFLLAGCLQPVVMITRGLSLRSALPDEAQTAAYSLMYSIQGIGYSITAAVAAVLVDHVSAGAAILTGVAICAALGAVSAVGERISGFSERASGLGETRPAADATPDRQKANSPSNAHLPDGATS
ncbi:hypothetical protein ABH926_003806 [Catenulispora sp. GP43]|uniref:hypothetical protein n=1 Tax=Catenulispora sp. GP43 TaxID=3156263 RepID=UPI0035152C56